MRKTSLLLTALGLGLSAFAVQVRAQSSAAAGTPATRSGALAASTVDARWKASFEAFAAEDKLHAPQPGGVLFVGSSSIRLWNGLEEAFAAPGQPVLKRGFGGSRMLDCAQYVDTLVLPYQPRLVVVYAGDNDLAEGRTPQQVLQSFTQFTEAVRQALPDTRIAYLSIKPSPLRAALVPAVREANSLIAAYAKATPNLDYIDVFSRMLTDDGQPRSDLYSADSLHMNAEGYALWRSVISPHLQPAGARQAALPAATPPAAAAPADPQALKTLVSTVR
ncbi:SGNH/GDSL hydrolase family protein [Aquincola tertiaricarbonis]|uniref:SGNH/GDSL hydrolase family protein n=1 Tax=Aquincola tertiaricarbonis TaxID=391953 RepID=A0ABY4RZW5_AQUTE|nr:SGNH/GDSL hydrolase family protein [Aquincola tertiaricarbonis]URI05983.1 SGNH/GDSL hydrolase family protein [Aquincola tertiaricarbonis]